MNIIYSQTVLILFLVTLGVSLGADRPNIVSVSYTHLTLPTILRV